MTNAIKMREMTDKHYSKIAAKRQNKTFKWIDKITKKMARRAKRGYSWMEFKIPNGLNCFIVTEHFKDAGYNLTKGSTHYRLTW